MLLAQKTIVLAKWLIFVFVFCALVNSFLFMHSLSMWLVWLNQSALALSIARVDFTYSYIIHLHEIQLLC